LNPAVAAGIALSHFASDSITNVIAYTAAEMFGAGLAAAVFTVTHKGEKGEYESQEDEEEGSSESE